MKKEDNFFREFLISISIFVFILIYILLLFNNFIAKNNFPVADSTFLFLGFFLIIVGIYLSFNLHPKRNQLFRFTFFSENLIKTIMLVFMIISYLFIPSITFSSTIVAWEYVEFSNLLRGIIFVIGGAFLPGSCLFNIIFGKDFFKKKFKVNLFLVKITFYPILSFALLGSLVLIFDQVGLLKETITLNLLLFLIFIYVLDLVIQKLRKQEIKKIFVKLDISKSTFVILLLALGIITFSLGIASEVKYLIPGDSWAEIAHANYIGRSYPSFNFSWITSSYYPFFWSYVSFAFSVLSGIPYININVLFTPFLYLFVTTTYFFVKAILKGFKEIYVIISTALTVTFSGIIDIFSINVIDDKGNISPLIFDGLINFRFKSFAIFLLFLGITLIITNFPNNEKLEKKSNETFEKYKTMNLAAFFFVISYMTYMLPLIFGLIILLIYCLFRKSQKKYLDLKYFSKFLLFVIIYFIIFDIITNFYLSDMAIYRIFYFYQIPIISNILELFPHYLFIYMILFAFLIIILFIQFLYILFQEKKLIKINVKFRINSKIIIGLFVSFLCIFTFFLIIFLQSFLNEAQILGINDNFLFFYFDNYLFGKIGIIGILGIIFSYFCYKKDKNLFLILIIWIVIILFISSLKFVEIFVSFFPSIPRSSEVIAVLSNLDYNLLEYWFTRTWYYIIPAFSILFTVAIIEFAKRVKKIRFFIDRKYLRKIARNFSISIFIFFSFSNLIVAGLYWENLHYRVKDDEAQIIGWVARNIPEGSNILIDAEFDQHLERTLEWNLYQFSSTVETAFNENFGKTNSWWFISYNYDTNCTLDLLNNFKGYSYILEFNDQNDNGNVNVGFNFNSPQKYGTIKYIIYTTSNSDRFWVDISHRTIDGPHLWNGSFSYYNGIKYVQLQPYMENHWYQVVIDFECTTGGYKGLNQYEWNLYINTSEFRNLKMYKNSTQIDSINFITAVKDSNWQTYLDVTYFSWFTRFKMEHFLFNTEYLDNYLLRHNIQFYIHTSGESRYKNNIEEKYLNIQDLIQNYFMVNWYVYGNLYIYTTPDAF